MKISKLTNGLLVSLLLSSSVVVADSDGKYPATNFQPTVVYQDSDYKHSGSLEGSASSSKGEVSVADPAYPAANFQPEVLYEDKEYKHTKDVVSVSKSSSASSSSGAGESSDSGVESADSGDSSLSLVLGLGVLAVAGFVFYTKNNKLQIKKPSPARKAAKRSAVVATSSDDSVSGVSKYLESKVGAKPSGVAKYLEDRDSSPVSGVAKYVAKKKVSARLASVTGVEKYLKDKG